MQYDTYPKHTFIKFKRGMEIYNTDRIGGFERSDDDHEWR